MLLEPIATRAVELSMLQWRTEVELEQEKAVVKARRYHDGEQAVFLNDRLRQFLTAADDVSFAMNVCRVVVEAVDERLIVKGFDAADPAAQAWAQEAWQAARMDTVADDVHEQALRDGESFTIWDWDAVAGRVRCSSHPRYTSVEADGDGFGCLMAYPDDDISQPPLYAVKRWTEFVDDAGLISQQRATFYYPDRIEKYVFVTGGWAHITDADGEPWPIPWLAKDGTPLGLPVIHFKNKGLRSEAWDAIPLQDGVNKTLVDTLAAADTTGFRIYVARGFIPTTDGKAYDGSNGLDIQPGQMIGTTADAGSTAFNAIDGADVGPLLDAVQKLVLFVAMVTSTPVARFMISGQVAAEGTLKEQQEPLLAKIRKRQSVFGDAWEDAMSIARRIENTFGTGAKLDESVALTTTWEPAAARAAAELQAEWTAKLAAGVPRKQVWSEMGYTPEQVAEFLNDPQVVFGTFQNYPIVPPTTVPTLPGSTA